MQFKSLFGLGVVCLAVWAAGAQSILHDTRTRRNLSLDECIRMTLEQNHRLHVIRFDPKIARFRLETSKGIYDPEFTSVYRRSFRSAEGEVDIFTGLPGSDSTTDEDRFTPGLGGVLPTGLRYDLFGDFRHTRGETADQGPFDEYTASAGIQLSQPLLRSFWTDADRTEIQVRKRELKISESTVEAEVRLVIRDVTAVYYELLFSLEDVKVQQKAYEVATNFVAQQQERVKAGKLAEIELKRAESQAATTIADWVLAQQRANAADNLLKSLITDKYKDWLNVRVAPTEKLVAVPERLDVYESWASALAERPDLRQLELQGDILRLEKRRRHNDLFPTLNLAGGYGRTGLDSTTTSNYFDPILLTNVTKTFKSSLGGALDDISQGLHERWNVGFVFNVPLSRKTERNRYKQAKEEENKNYALLDQLHQAILVEVDQAIDQARADYQRISLTHQARIFAEAALDAEEQRLLSGKGTIFLVLEAQQRLTQAKSNELRAQTDYLIRLNNVRFSDGTILQRNKVSIRFK
jgi:outer membrane protein TolC